MQGCLELHNSFTEWLPTCKATVKLGTNNSERELEFDKLLVAAGGDSGHVGEMLGLGLGQGELRWDQSMIVNMNTLC